MIEFEDLKKYIFHMINEDDLKIFAISQLNLTIKAIYFLDYTILDTVYGITVCP